MLKAKGRILVVHEVARITDPTADSSSAPDVDKDKDECNCSDEDDEEEEGESDTESEHAFLKAAMTLCFYIDKVAFALENRGWLDWLF